MNPKPPRTVHEGLIRRKLIIAVVLCFGLVTVGCSTGSEDSKNVQSGESGSQQETGPDSVVGPAEPTWDSSTISLPGEVGQPVNYCNSIDWQPVLALFADLGVAETNRLPGSWDEVHAYDWPTTGNSPAGRIYVGSCMLLLSSDDDPTRSIGGAHAQVWVFEANEDAAAYWASWKANDQFAASLDPATIPGSKLAALAANFSGHAANPAVLAVGDHVMLSVSTTSRALGNSDIPTALDPPADALEAALSAVAADALAHANQ